MPERPESRDTEICDTERYTVRPIGVTWVTRMSGDSGHQIWRLRQYPGRIFRVRSLREAERPVH